MKLKAFSLIESLVALSILAFVTAGCLYVVGGLYSSSKIDMGQVYNSVKVVENLPLLKTSLNRGAYSVDKVIEPYGDGLLMVTITARHHRGRTLIQTRKIVPDEK